MPRNPTASREAVTREKVAWLADPCHYGRLRRPVEIIETHFAWVFLAGDRAYKLKKPLRQGSMDHRTLARRERACRDELRLNRRLAPHVYLRVVPLRRDRQGSFSLRPAAGARVTDWLVEMRRLPAARMLDRLIAARGLRPADLDGLVAVLAAFFRHALRRPLTDAAYRERLCREIRRNADELIASDLGLSRSKLVSLAEAQLAFVGRHPRTLAGRGARLLDGHGDLRPEHVFLGTSSMRACVIDCLEFDRDLRRLDPAEEVAFLALECERLGAAAAADGLLARYRRAAGDPAPPMLIQFYMSRRAAVRAQIAAWHLRDPAFAGEARAWKARADSYLADALRHIHRAVASDQAWRRNRAAEPRPAQIR
ncbi:MAG TPA: hypothetical protein VFN79_18470 [Steroidobacteraceae bacterium]|jgi:aminoglycoside phosphotransferase family enzyme|nr:hypothetical protein [Steroidobacteraceae bacterium]